jgi:3-hydroxybutyrate dehydrogenase
MIKGKSALVTSSTAASASASRALAAEGANIMLNGFGDAGTIDAAPRRVQR